MAKPPGCVSTRRPKGGVMPRRALYSRAYERGMRLAGIFARLTRIDRRLEAPRSVFALVWDRTAKAIEDANESGLPPCRCTHCARRYRTDQEASLCCDVPLPYIRRAGRPTKLLGQ